MASPVEFPVHIPVTVTGDSRFAGAMGRIEKRTQSLHQTMARVKSLAGTLFAGFSAALIVRQMTSAARAFSEFEARSAGVRAVLEATREQMQPLIAQTRELGATTVFTALQAAQAQENLARAGFTARENLAALPAVLNVAAADELELGRAAEIVAGTLRGFQLDAREAGDVTDVLARISSRATTDINEMGEALKFAAPTAKGLEISLRDTTAALGVLADNMLRGTLGGTGFRQALVALINPGVEAASVLQELGVSSELFRQTIKERGLAAALSLLVKGTSDVRDAIEIAGARGGTALQVLLTNLDKLAEKRAALDDVTGAAKRMADVKLDTLRGEVKELESAWEGLQITFGGGVSEGLRPALGRLTEDLRGSQAVAQELGQQVGAVLSRLIDLLLLAERHSGTLKGAIAAIVAIQFGKWLTSAVVAMQAYVVATRAATAANVGFLGSLRPLTGLLGLVLAAVVAANEAINKWARDTASQTQQIITDMTNASNALKALGDEAMQAIASNDLQGMSTLLGQQTTRLEELKAARAAATEEMNRLAANMARASQQGNLHGAVLDSITASQAKAAEKYNKANVEIAALTGSTDKLKEAMRRWKPVIEDTGGGAQKLSEAMKALLEDIQATEMIVTVMRQTGATAEEAARIVEVLMDSPKTATAEALLELVRNLNAAKGAAIDAGAVIDKLLGFDKRIPLGTVDLNKFDAQEAAQRAAAAADADKMLERLRQRDTLLERIGTRQEQEAAIRRRVNELADQLLLTEAQRARIMAEQLGILVDQSKLIRGLGAAASIIGSLPGSASQLGPFVQSFTDQFARFRRVMVEGGAEAEGYGSRLEAVRSISAQAASTAIGLANALGMLSSRQQELAGALGAAGAIAGGIFGGPVGAEVGAAVGQILGVVIGGMQSVEQTFADGGAVLGRLAAQLHEGTGQLAELTNQAVQSIVDTVNGIVEETGIALQELSPGSQRGTFGFQIRQRGDEIIAVKAWVDGVMREFDSIDQATGFVVTEMIRRADASGADPFVRVALETFAGNTIDGLNRALAEAFERQQLVASVDQLGLGRLQALGIPEDIEDRVRRQAEAWNAQRNALEASLLAVRARILADQAQAESSAAVARVQVESNRTMLEGMLNLSEGMQAAGRSATVAGAIVSGAFDDALAAVDAALAGLDALIGESEIMEAVDRQRREANRGRREAREAARAAAQAELDLLIARAQGGAAAEELLRRQMEEAALIARLTEALPGLTAAEIELLQARIRSQAATESILAAGSDILDRIESQRIAELFGSVGSGIFDLADAMAEAQQQIFDAVQGGGSPFEAIRRMGELSDAAPDAIRRMLEAALESAASDPEAIAALRRQLADLLLNLPEELEGQRDLIAAFAAGLGLDLANALSGAIITAQSSIASFGGELASALQRFGGAAAVTEEERARLLEIEFRLIQAQAVVRISQLRQEIAAMQALGALVSSQLDDLGFLETLADRLAELEPDFGALAREVNGAQNAVRDFGDAAERTGEQLRQAAEAADAGLERLRDELLGGRLSGLSGLEQNQFALDRVRDLITRARGGDVDARRELESEGRNLIELAMQNLDVGGAGSQRQELLAALDDILRHPVPIPDDPVVEAIHQVRQAINLLSVTQDSRLADLVAAANTIPAGLTSIKDGLKPIADGLGLVPIELQKIPTALDALGDILDNKPGGGGSDLPNFKAATPGYVVDVPAFEQRSRTNFLLAEISDKLDAIEPKGATF